MAWRSFSRWLGRLALPERSGSLLRSAIAGLSIAVLTSSIPGGSAVASDNALVDDPFSRKASNSWGSAAVGGKYTLTGPSTSFSVNGSRGLIVLSANGKVHAASPQVSARDVNVTFRFGVDRLPKAGYLNLSVVARAVDARSHYRLVVRISRSGAVALRAIKVVDGRKTALGRTVALSGVRISAGKHYRLRFRAMGAGPTVLQGKVWPAGRAQPTTWGIRRSDTAARLQKTGRLAVRASASVWAAYVPVRFQYDDLVVRQRLTTSDPPSTLPNTSSDDYLLMPRSELLSLSTSSSAWSALKKVADGSWGSADLCNQDTKHGAKALAGALVFARTGNSSYYTKTRNAIMSAMGTERSDCNMLSIARQLGSYVLAADFIKLAGSDDSNFRSWLSKMRTRSFSFHSRWQVLIDTHADANNNWGSFAGASRIAASLYLGDTSDVAAAAKVVRGFFGDRSAYSGFRSLSLSEVPWTCSGSSTNYTPINPACTKLGINLDGAIVGDVYRDGKGRIWPVGSTGIGYTLESLQGLTLQTELLARNGYGAAWGWSNSALRRAAGLVTRNGKAGGPSWNYSSVSYHVPWLLNFRYGLNLPTKSAGVGRIFGYTDWLYGGR